MDIKMGSSSIIFLTFILIFLIFFVIIPKLKSPWFKGFIGEHTINSDINRFLDKNVYHLIKNVTLPTENGSTQIDHIIVSIFGIFVIETKNMKGWIFGDHFQNTWTQKIYRYSNKFQNPLHQNFKHTKTLEFLLGLSAQQIHSVIVFVGDSVFKTEMPENVTHGSAELIRYIKSKYQIVLTESEVHEITSKIRSNRLTPSFKTNREHVAHVKNIKAQKENESPYICPRCGSPMVTREVKKGRNLSKLFLGCSNFPECKLMYPKPQAIPDAEQWGFN